MVETVTLGDRLAQVRARIDAAAPEPEKVTLVAVTKKFGPKVAKEALDVGLRELGENYAQELVAKSSDLSELCSGNQPEVNWHFVGRLQRNKVKKIAGLVSLWHTVDRPEIVTEIAKRAPNARILVQVNTTGEEQKSGCDPTDVAELVEQARSCDLRVVGLMTIGPTDGSDPAPAFSWLRESSQKLEVPELSMGMSADLEVALAEGATMVRVGSALFGPRSTR